ncbi:hypothetical protein SAMN05216483_6790 [Streptomyces sp. 2131.1]|uniref:hypothetical protein n=1 Tax=Streptomyces sp. 2131.1 TaxID=1855346 RepID=UPI000899EF0F|nr:hypothetical protein [Streptomyces sp. 2131.1]SEE85145.1 hypothetical protein SAMN05216483_6790 [Streptomyces sp. 2131.1]
MSTTPNLSLQVYDPDGTPIPPAVSREHLLNLACGAYKRGGTYLSRGDLDIELAEVADKAACSLLRDRWDDKFPIAAYTELLAAVAALRAVLGFDPTPTAPEVIQWAKELGEGLASGVEANSLFYVGFTAGPYRGAVLRFPGVRNGRGPAESITLPIAWGDTAAPGRGQAQYRRSPIPNDEGLWLYQLDKAVREDARPDITVPPSAQGGA